MSRSELTLLPRSNPTASQVMMTDSKEAIVEAQNFNLLDVRCKRAGWAMASNISTYSGSLVMLDAGAGRASESFQRRGRNSMADDGCLEGERDVCISVYHKTRYGR